MLIHLNSFRTNTIGFIISISLSACIPTKPTLPIQSGGSKVVTGVDEYSNISVSPDGKKLAFVRNNALYICDTSGANVNSISPKGLYVNEPKWSPDGSRIGFIQIDPSNWGTQKFSTIDVASHTVISQPTGDHFVPNNSWSYFWDWSPDNQNIAVLCYSPSGGHVLKIFQADANGNLINSFPASVNWVPWGEFPGPEQVFHWSPDGSQIVLVTYLNGSRAISVATIGTTNIIEVIPDTTAHYVDWFPDGDNISYIDQSGLRVHNLTSSQDSVIIPYFDYHYQISPNALYVGYVSSYWDGNPDGPHYYYINAFNVRTGQSAYLATSNSYLVFSWAPSSRQVFYTFDSDLYEAINSM